MSYKYDHLVFGSLRFDEIMEAVKDPEWQRFRVSLKGQSTQTKLDRLTEWVKSHPGRQTEIRVTNYINALKRGGQLK